MRLGPKGGSVLERDRTLKYVYICSVNAYFTSAHMIMFGIARGDSHF